MMMRAMVVCAAMICAFGGADARPRRHHAVTATSAIPIEVATSRVVASELRQQDMARRQARFLPADLPAYPDPDASGVKVKLHVNRVKVSAPIDLNIAD